MENNRHGYSSNIESLPPNWFEPLKKSEKPTQVIRKSLTFWQDAWRRLKQNRLAIAGLWALLLLIFFSVISPWMSTYTYYDTHLDLKNLPPSSLFWFGTDDLGRDMFTRIWYGARISLLVGISAALIDVIIGVLWGGCAGYFGGKVDNILMRFADILFAVPYLLKVILFMVVLGQGLITIVLAMSLTGWINMARIVRGQIMQLKGQEFVLAALALGASQKRILFHHLIPNAIGPIIVTVTLTIPTAIFTEAFLSFLGLGVQVPIASWGTMANDGLPALKYYPWRLFFPAAFISITMLSFNLVGDGLRDAFDPRLRKN